MAGHTPVLNQTVGQLVAERPERGRVFERLGIDYCCSGRRSLAEACAQRGLDPEHVRSQLDAAGAVRCALPGPDWTTAPLSQLADHIETTHHDAMRRELPRIAGLLQRVVSAHGATRPELADIEQTFGEFASDLMSHMSKKESVLFPWIRSLEAGPVEKAQARGLEEPIRRMMLDHDDAGRALLRLRQLTNSFAPPQGACGTFRVMLSGLKELESDMHAHVHKENNILFPRALAREASPAGACTLRPSVP